MKKPPSQIHSNIDEQNQNKESLANDSVSVAPNPIEKAQSRIGSLSSFQEKIKATGQRETLTLQSELSKNIEKLQKNASINKILSLSHHSTFMPDLEIITKLNNNTILRQIGQHKEVNHLNLIKSLEGSRQEFNTHNFGGLTMDLSPLRTSFELISGIISNQAMFSLNKYLIHEGNNNKLSSLLNNIGAGTLTLSDRKLVSQTVALNLATFVDSTIIQPNVDINPSTSLTSNPQHDPQESILAKLEVTWNSLPNYLQIILIVLIVKILGGALEDYAKEKILHKIHQAESYILSPTENKPLTKTDIIKSDADIDWEHLNHFRFITGDNVMLRMSPSMNSEIIEKLDKNTIVAVIGKKDRQWIYVQVKSGNDILLGWVNRTYTKPLKR